MRLRIEVGVLLGEGVLSETVALMRGDMEQESDVTRPDRPGGNEVHPPA